MSGRSNRRRILPAVRPARGLRGSSPGSTCRCYPKPVHSGRPSGRTADTRTTARTRTRRTGKCLFLSPVERGSVVTRVGGDNVQLGPGSPQEDRRASGPLASPAPEQRPRCGRERAGRRAGQAGERRTRRRPSPRPATHAAPSGQDEAPAHAALPVGARGPAARAQGTDEGASLVPLSGRSRPAGRRGSGSPTSRGPGASRAWRASRRTSRSDG